MSSAPYALSGWLLLLSGCVEIKDAEGAQAQTDVGSARRSPPQLKLRADGRLTPYPGALVRIGAEATGALKEVLAAEKSPVAKGDALATFDDGEALAALDEARAILKEARAVARTQKKSALRLRRLGRSGVVTTEQVDRASGDGAAFSARTAAA